MRAIIIGAGRGQRLMPLTDDVPKCYAEVAGRRILDWGLEALHAGGLDEVVFIGGYRIDRVRTDYPQLSFRHNDAWERNNILASLFYAEDAMSGGFLSAYADILYRPALVAALLAAPGDIALAVDIDWRARYASRSAHPESDAEKVRIADGRVIRVSRDIPADAADGEFVGIARFTPAGAARLRHHYRARRAEHDGRPYRGAPSFERAYLIHLLQDMIERGVPMAAAPTAGGYLEVDTTEDYALAQELWR